MWQSLKKSIFLLTSLVVVVCGIYPFALWVIGQAAFPFQANGSIVYGLDKKPVGSLLIAQGFTQDKYFQPRPSAASYDASASASSSLASSNYALRDRVARTLGPIVKYQNGQLVGSDIVKWFGQNKFQGQSRIVSLWATQHPTLASAWVSADVSHSAYVDAWAKAHPALLAQFIKDNPGTPKPSATDLALVFFQNYAAQNPGKFPLATAVDIQAMFFDMWRQDHADVALQEVPGDLVTTSASGLDPDITLQNAQFQLDRVASGWAQDLKQKPDTVKQEIAALLLSHAKSPLGGLLGDKMVNVLEVNLALQQKWGAKE